MYKLLTLSVFTLLLFSCSKNIYQQKEEYIKFKNIRSKIYVKLKVNQYNDGDFCFDTGVNRFIIDSTFYKRQQMTFNNYSQTQSNGVGNILAKMIRINDTIRFSINNHSFLSKQNVIHNLKKSLGKNIDGLFSFTNFGNTPFKIDYLNNKIVLNPKINDGYHEIAIKFDGDFMYLPVELILKNGTTIKGNFVIDTGAGESMLTSEFANNKDVLSNKKSNYKNNGGIGGVHLGFSFFVSQLKIDTFKLAERKIHVSKDSIGALTENSQEIGIIGNDVLDNFDIIYHPTKQKIWVKPSQNFNKPSDDLYKPFILIEPEDSNKGWIVVSIYEDSDAYIQGLRHQDEIVEINNKSVKKIDREKFMRKLQPNQKLKLKIKRKNEYFEIDTYLNIFLKKNDK